MLASDAEADAFARVWHGAGGPGPLEVHPRALGGAAVLVRPRTTDAQVLDDTFVGLYHLPPADLPAGAVILDLGSNVGYTAAHFAAASDGASVLCVEMDGANAAVARANLRPWADRCRVVHAAAWDREGELAYAGEEAWGYRVAALDGAAPGAAGGGGRAVRAATVDALLREHGVERVDYAKVDIEGAEAVVIAADAPWLRRVRAIKVEHHPPATAASIDAALRGAGFRTRPDDRHPRCIVGVRA